MSKKTDKPTPAGKSRQNKAALVGAAIGSAALAAALLYVTRRKEKSDKPLHPEQAPETD
jgi:hypothetical protein